MKFTDELIDNVDITEVNSFFSMIIKHLCGEVYYKEPSDDHKTLISKLLKNAKGKRLTHEQFNELLLLLHQGRVSEDFFKFFFGEDDITLDELKQGVIKFRGYAMLLFGNFRFAYKKLSQKNREELEKQLGSYFETSRPIKKHPNKMLEITEIDRDKTYYAGYISKTKFATESDYMNKLIRSRGGGAEKGNILEELKGKEPKNYETIYGEQMRLAEKYLKMYLKIHEDIKDIEEKALGNTDIYLTWDYMDVYIATSMRHKWEFEETFDFIRNVFNKEKFDGRKNPLKDLNLRYFDPTQSLCKNRIDKGLIEGLMLKRTACTIYMIQESDTMGKDSELAATLAQGKPVIAYIPRKDNIDYYLKQIKEYPLEFFGKRLLILDAEGIFDDKSLIQKLDKDVADWREVIDNYLEELRNHRSKQPFTLIEEEERRFKDTHREFDKLCKILAITESHNFDKRAKTLQEIHPLAIQVDLQRGVANGVLVVRTAEECANLIYRLLNNSMEFTIKHKLFNLTESDFKELCSLVGKLKENFYYEKETKTLVLKKDLTNEEIDRIEQLSKEESCPEAIKGHLKRFGTLGVTVLGEQISSSPYRAVTNYKKLTNSFWNFYLQ